MEIIAVITIIGMLVRCITTDMKFKKIQLSLDRIEHLNIDVGAT